MRQGRLLSLCLFMLLASCQTDAYSDHALRVQQSLSGPAAAAIAGDLSARLAEQRGNGPKTVHFDSDGSEFAVALEAALKGWGYEIAGKETGSSGKGDAKPLALAYSLSSLDDQVFAALLTDQVSVSRIYAATSEGATPASPLSVSKPN